MDSLNNLMEEVSDWENVWKIPASIRKFLEERTEWPSGMQSLRKRLLLGVINIEQLTGSNDATAILRSLGREQHQSVKQALQSLRRFVSDVPLSPPPILNCVTNMPRGFDPTVPSQLENACQSIEHLSRQLNLSSSLFNGLIAQEHQSVAQQEFIDEFDIDDMATGTAVDGQPQGDDCVFSIAQELFGQRLRGDWYEKMLRACSQLYIRNATYFALGANGGTSIDLSVHSRPEHSDMETGEKNKRGGIDNVAVNGSAAELKMSCAGGFYFYIFHSTPAGPNDDTSRTLHLIYPVSRQQSNSSSGDEIPRGPSHGSRRPEFRCSKKRFPSGEDGVQYTLSTNLTPSILMVYVALTRRKIELPENVENGSREGEAVQWIFSNMHCAESIVKRITILMK